MGLFQRLVNYFIPRLKSADYWPSGGTLSGRTHTRAGVQVDEELALTYSPVWRCVRIISEATAGLPVHLYHTLEDNSREVARGHAKNRLIKYPNPRMGGRSLREGMTVHQALYGNGFAEIEYTGDAPVFLWPIHASRVRPSRPSDRLSNGEKIPEDYYIVRNNDGTSMALAPREMLHIPGAITEDGVWGKSIVQYAKECIGFGIAHVRHGATSFGAGNMPRGLISLPGMKDPEVRRQYRQEWKELHGSPDSGELAIIPVEGKFQQLSMSNVDSEFSIAALLPVKDVARFFGLPLHMLGEHDKAASYASVEMQGIEFVKYSLLPWVQRWDEQLNLKLLTEAERDDFYFEHNVEGLQRGDFKSRMEGYKVGREIGLYSINMIAAKENEPGIGAAGDVRLVPMNMTTAERMMEGPQAEEPPALEVPEEDEYAGEGEPAEELLDVPDFRQTTTYSCGCVALMSVAEYFGVGNGRTEQDYIAELGATEKDGTAPDKIMNWLTDNGLAVTAANGLTLDNLRAFFEAGQPVIVPLQMYGLTPDYDGEEVGNRTGHYVVVIGCGLGQVFIQDPSAGRAMVGAEEFDKIWHDMEADGVVSDHFGIAVGEAVALQTQEEKDAENANGEVDVGADGGDRGNPVPRGNREAIEAAKSVLLDTLSRMYTKEANAATRAAKGDFLTWAETWETKHKQTLMDALAPACAALRAAGIQADAGELARRLSSESVATLKLAYDTDTREKFAARMAAWAKENTDKVVRDFGIGD